VLLAPVAGVIRAEKKRNGKQEEWLKPISRYELLSPFSPPFMFAYTKNSLRSFSLFRIHIKITPGSARFRSRGRVSRLRHVLVELTVDPTSCDRSHVSLLEHKPEREKTVFQVHSIAFDARAYSVSARVSRGGISLPSLLASVNYSRFY
jgi:RNA recognition motif-containing protein